MSDQNQSSAQKLGQNVSEADSARRHSINCNVSSASRFEGDARAARGNASCDAISRHRNASARHFGMQRFSKQVAEQDLAGVCQWNNQTIADIETFEWTTTGHQKPGRRLKRWPTTLMAVADRPTSCPAAGGAGRRHCGARLSHCAHSPVRRLNRAQSERLRVKKVNGRGRRRAAHERIETAPSSRGLGRVAIDSLLPPLQTADGGQNRGRHAGHTTDTIDRLKPLDLIGSPANRCAFGTSAKIVEHSAEESGASSITTNRDVDCHESSCAQSTGEIRRVSKRSQVASQIFLDSDGFVRASVLVSDNQTRECANESGDGIRSQEGGPSGCSQLRGLVSRVRSLTTSAINSIRERASRQFARDDRPTTSFDLLPGHLSLPPGCCEHTNQANQTDEGNRLIDNLGEPVYVGDESRARLANVGNCQCLFGEIDKEQFGAARGDPIGYDRHKQQILADDAAQTISIEASSNMVEQPTLMMTSTAGGNEQQAKINEQQPTRTGTITLAASEIGNMESRIQQERELAGVCNRTPSQQQIRQKHFSLGRSSERRSTHCSSSGAMTATDLNCDSSMSSGGLNYYTDPPAHNQLSNNLHNQQVLGQPAGIKHKEANLMGSGEIMVQGHTECASGTSSSPSIELCQKQTVAAASKFAFDQCRITLSPNNQKPRVASKPVHTNKPLKKRDIWGKNIEFLLAVIGFAVDLGNIWRFPYICYKNGGGAFLIPYTIMFILGGLPIFYLEMSLGQYFSSGCLTIWRRVCPMAKGIGYAMCMLNFYTGLYYNTVISWAVFFFVESFTLDSLPWTSCNNPWNEKGCRTIEQREEMLRIEDYSGLQNITSPTQDYFNREVLQVHRSEGITDLGSIRAPLAIYLAIVFICIYFAIWKGVRSTGKAVWITALLPYFVLIPLLVRGVLLEGSLVGIKYYLKPNWSKILYVDVWVEAAKQIYFALGPGFGTLMALSSYNKFNHNCRRDALIAAAVNYFASFIAGLVIFAVLGYMATIGRTSVENVAAEGPGLVFQVYPEGLATMSFSAMWSVLFFLMVITLGIDSTFGGLESVITGLCDEYPRVLRAHRGIFIGVLIMIIYICSLPTTTYGGNYVIGLLESYGTSVSLLFIVTAETIVVCWIYGAEKFCNNLEEMYGETPGLYWRICWKYISPTILILILSGACMQEWQKYHVLMLGDYQYPDWAPPFGLLITFSSICCVPIYAIYYLRSNTSGNIFERLKSGIRPKAYDETDNKDHDGQHLDTDI